MKQASNSNKFTQFAVIMVFELSTLEHFSIYFLNEIKENKTEFGQFGP